MATPYTLSIEPTTGAAFQHGYHLGTMEPMARICAEQTFNDRNANGLYTRTVALMRYGLVVDVFDGAWASDRDNDIEVVW